MNPADVPVWITPLEPAGHCAANATFPRDAPQAALRGGRRDPEAGRKYPVSQATGHTLFWARHPAEWSQDPKAEWLVCMS